MVTIVDMLQRLIDERGHSLQFRPGEPPFLVVGETQRTLDLPPLTARHIHRFFDQLLSDEMRVELQRAGQVDGTYDMEGSARTFLYRARLMDTGPAIAFRCDVSGGPTASTTAAAATKDVAPDATRDAAPARTPAPAPIAAASSAGVFMVAEQTFDGLIGAIIEQHASDLILSSGRPARVRVAGDFLSVPWAIFDEEKILEPLGAMFTPEREARLAATGSVDVGL